MGKRLARRFGVFFMAVVLVLVALLFLLTPGRPAARSTSGPEHETLAFPPGFLWGAALAGQQAESQQNTDWTAFENEVARTGRFSAGADYGTTQPGNIRDFGRWSEEVRRRKSDFDRQYAGDIALAADMGLRGLRVSVEWARLFPRSDLSAPDPAGVAYYRALFAAMHARGIEPVVTLFHYVSPRWFFEADATGKRGWERADALALWTRFVEAVAHEFVGDARVWCTLNEPMVYLFNGYVDGAYPPLERRGDLAAAAPVYINLLRAHASAYDALHRAARERGTTVQVGFTQAIEDFEPQRNLAPADRLIARLVDQAWNWDALDAAQQGRLHITASDVEQAIDGLRGKMDYVGINYYTRIFVRGDLLHPDQPQILQHDAQSDQQEASEMGWPIYPHGLYNALAEARRRYDLPIYILENGDTDSRGDDAGRQDYIKAHVRETWLAIRQAGADVRGYFYWSLLDNFEWVDGFGPHFGLISVDYERGFARRTRASAAVLRAIATANALPAAFNEVRYP